MSWGIQVLGTVEGIAAELDAFGSKLDPYSSKEFENVKPHLKALVAQNFGGVVPTHMRLEAGGHGTWKDGALISAHFTVTLGPSYHRIVI